MANTKRGKSFATTKPTVANESPGRSLALYVTTKQASAMLGVDHQHVAHLLKAGKLKGVKLGHDWIVFIPSLHSYVKMKSARGRPTSKKPKL